MIKAIFQRWFFCTISILAALIAALGMLQSFRNRDALGFVVSLVLFIADGVCVRSLWPGDKHDEDVTQPLPMPQVPDPVTQPLPALDIEDIYREALEAAFEDDDGYWSDGVEV